MSNKVAFIKILTLTLVITLIYYVCNISGSTVTR